MEPRRPRSVSSTFSNPASEQRRHEDEKDTGSPADASPSSGANERAEVCEDCLTDAQHHATYLVEVTNYPALQTPKERYQVFAKGEYDAILLVHDIGSRGSFEAAQDLHSEIPLRHGRRGRKRSPAGKHRVGAQEPHQHLPRRRGDGGNRGGGNAKETVVALVGNKSDFDEEYASASLGLDPDHMLRNKEAVLQEADVEERSLVHPCTGRVGSTTISRP